MNSKSTLGHFLGKTGSGPRFLAETLVLSKMFTECMVKKVWEGFSGVSVDDLNLEEKKSFEEMSSKGPRTLLDQALRSKSIQCVREKHESCSL